MARGGGGGPVNKFKITLRMSGDKLDPDQISHLLVCAPTRAETKGESIIISDRVRIARTGRWSVSLHSTECADGTDVEEGIKLLLLRFPADLKLWEELTTDFKADVFCGIFLDGPNRGFAISAATSRLLADRNLEIGFDIYGD